MKSLGRIVVILLVLFTLLSTFGTTQPVMAQSTEHWCGGTSETEKPSSLKPLSTKSTLSSTSSTQTTSFRP